MYNSYKSARCVDYFNAEEEMQEMQEMLSLHKYDCASHVNAEVRLPSFVAWPPKGKAPALSDGGRVPCAQPALKSLATACSSGCSRSICALK